MYDVLLDDPKRAIFRYVSINTSKIQHKVSISDVSRVIMEMMACEE